VASLTALDGVSFDIAEGEFFGLLGPNGAGKTTLISILAGLSRATSATVSVRGHDVQPTTRRRGGSSASCRRNWCSTRSSPCARRCASSRATSACGATRPGSTELLESLGLADKANANMRQLSGGMKRRVLVAQALVHKPPVIVLDEPTAGVDVELRQTLWQFIARLNREGTPCCSPPTTWRRPRRCATASRCSSKAAWSRWSAPATCSRPRPATCCASRSTASCRPSSRPRRASPGASCNCPRTTRTKIENYWRDPPGRRAVEDVEIRKADLEDVFLDVMSAQHQQLVA
jgi:ABC-2 type transport system ATP-binding protein